jgi:hypothetical protein
MYQDCKDLLFAFRAHGVRYLLVTQQKSGPAHRALARFFGYVKNRSLTVTAQKG